MDLSSAKNPWIIGPTEQAKYDSIFDGLLPIEGRVSGEKCKPIFLNSKLPVDVLGRVWDLSDIDKDGFLDRDEFRVAMHLVYKALEKEPVPLSLPPSLIPQSKRAKVIAPPAYSLATGMPPVHVAMPAAAQLPWVVSLADKMIYDDLFRKADLDKDGFVDGGEIKDTFLQSGLPPPVLAKVWALCDIRNIGKLNMEQFALAMFLIKLKLSGSELPPQLTPEMIPPSFRIPSASFPSDPLSGIGSMDGGFSVVGDTTTAPAISNELLTFQKEIENMKREKMRVEQERLQLQMDAAACNCELELLQKELDAIVMTTKQLETQKGEARKRLDELEDRKVKLDFSVKEIRTKCAEEEEQIVRLKRQTDDDENSAKRQESDLRRMKDELGRLRAEELELEQRIDISKSQLEQFVKTLLDSQSVTSQTKSSISSMQQVRDKLVVASRQYSALINGEPGATEPVLDDFTDANQQNGFHDNAFTSNGFGSATFGSRPVVSQDIFAKADPFNSAEPAVYDPFSSSDPFSDMSTSANSRLTNDIPSSNKTVSDPFGGSSWDSNKAATTTTTVLSSDPWGFSSSASSAKASFGDPFGASAFGAQDLVSPVNPSDPFGTGSFGTSDKKKKSPAPPRPNSATAFASKNKKAPPPPRPPAPKKGADGSDPFGADPFSSSSVNSSDPFGSSSFADFGSQFS